MLHNAAHSLWPRISPHTIVDRGNGSPAENVPGALLSTTFPVWLFRNSTTLVENRRTETSVSLRELTGNSNSLPSLGRPAGEEQVIGAGHDASQNR